MDTEIHNRAVVEFAKEGFIVLLHRLVLHKDSVRREIIVQQDRPPPYLVLFNEPFCAMIKIVEQMLKAKLFVQMFQSIDTIVLVAQD
jgi:hypothetical protein